jgi:Caspase domain
MSRRALVIGIHAYPDRSLRSSVADAEAVAALLDHDYDSEPNWTTQRMLSLPDRGAIDRSVLGGELANFFGTAHRDDLLLYFAGHAVQTRWGVELATETGTRPGAGVSLNDLFSLINKSPASSITVILDCCFAGDLGDEGTFGENLRRFEGDRALLREELTILAASGDNEPAKESSTSGAFTGLLVEGLEGGAGDHRGRVMALGLFSYISAAASLLAQHPQIKTNSIQPPVLRRSAPWIETDLLRELPRHFLNPDSRIELSPEHEGRRPWGPEGPTLKQSQFDYLGQLRNASLAIGDGGRTFYDLAMNGGTIHLTPVGKHFWRLAARHAI